MLESYADAMTWRHLTTRDPVRLKSSLSAPPWLALGMEIDARVVAILGAEDDAPIVVKVVMPNSVGLDDSMGLHLTLAEAGAKWRDTGVVDVRRFWFPPESPALHEGVTGASVDGRLIYERRPFDLAEVFAEAHDGGGSRMISGVELSQFIEYARTRDATVTFVEAYELRGALEIPRIDLGVFDLDGDDLGLTDSQRIDLVAGNVREILALAEKEGLSFGYRVWLRPSANR